MRMRSKELTVLKEAFPAVVEKMTFLFAEPADLKAVTPQRGPWISVRMGFEGPMTGLLELAVPKPLCTEIAANMLGVEPSDDRAGDRALDATAELLNVTCGKALAKIAGDKPVFRLTSPVTAPLLPDCRQEMQGDTDTVAFTIDGQLLMLRLDMEDALP
jgi:CheY-specific phosphatase CheX